MSKWSDAGRVLSQLPPVAVVALHFVLVYLPAKLRSAGNGGGSACRGNGTPAAAAPVAAGSGDEEGTGSTATPLPPAAAPGKDGGLRADSSGLGAAGGAAAAAAAGSRGGGGGGGGGVGLGVGAGGGVSQLGDVPSHVFDVVLPSDPAFDAEVSCCTHRTPRWLVHLVCIVAKLESRVPTTVGIIAGVSGLVTCWRAKFNGPPYSC